MQVADRARLSTAGVVLFAGVALLAGCSSVIDGDPVAAPGSGPASEPSFPTSRPSTPRPTAPPTTPPTSSPPSGAISLQPNNDGYVFIETKSGKTRCQIDSASVGCEAAFTNSPIKDGTHANGVNISASGDVEWVLGNLGAIPTVTIDYLTYAAQGWTIAASIEGTRFSNDRTGHGMFVSIDKVETF